MITKLRRLEDSRTKDSLGLKNSLTKNQYNTLESILNCKLSNCILYDYRNGGLYKNKMIPASLNDISKAIGKKVDKLFRSLVSKGAISQVIDVRGRKVWMINPDLYWDYVSYELYYNRWLFSTKHHEAASKIVDASLYYGYFYHSYSGKPIKKISQWHWYNMFKWWKMFIGTTSPDLLEFIPAIDSLKASVSLCDKRKALI